MTQKTWRNLSLFWCLFIGVGAVGGAITMFVDPMGQVSGMGGLIPGFQTLPLADVLFQNLVFPGIALLIVNGLTQLVTAALLFSHKPVASKCVVGCGVILMLWICIQFVIYPFNWLSTGYFVFGLLEAVCGLALRKKEREA